MNSIAQLGLIGGIQNTKAQYTLEKLPLGSADPTQEPHATSSDTTTAQFSLTLTDRKSCAHTNLISTHPLHSSILPRSSETAFLSPSSSYADTKLGVGTEATWSFRVRPTGPD